MDLYKTIRTLHEERKRLDKLIESLEQLQSSEDGIGRTKIVGRRGRKGMSAEERGEVSERMKRYWASRRAVAGAAQSEQSAAGAAVVGR